MLELSLAEALRLGHNYIGTEHVLLGLVRENEGVAARILLDFGADAEKIRSEVFRMLSGPDDARGSAELAGVIPLTSPPLAPKVMEELERVAAEKERAIDSSSSGTPRRRGTVSGGCSARRPRSCRRGEATTST